MWRPASLSLVMGLAACGEAGVRPLDEAVPVDFQNDTEELPSHREMAILALVNDPAVGVEELDHGVKLDARAARNIVAHRNGPDGMVSTEDDRPFRRLVDVDAVPWVGVVGLMKLYDYARAHGYLATYQMPSVNAEIPVREDVGFEEADLLDALRAARITDADAVLTRGLIRFDDGDSILDREELFAAAESCRDDIYTIEGYRWAESVVDRIMETFDVADRLSLLAAGVMNDEDQNRYLSQDELERAMILLTR